MTGIICLRKPEGITSFQAVRKTRGITGEKKAGHCGTLDPDATGVLPVMLGGATRFLEFLPTTPKQYRAVMKLGVVTDTLDLSERMCHDCSYHILGDHNIAVFLNLSDVLLIFSHNG